MARYEATFDSEDPKIGVVVDNQKDRHAFFPTLDRAQRAADSLLDTDEPPFIWRRNSDGERE